MVSIWCFSGVGEFTQCERDAGLRRAVLEPCGDGRNRAHRQHACHGIAHIAIVHRGLVRTILTLLAAAVAFGQSSDYDQGVARFNAGDFAGAVPLLTRATESHPKDAQAWKALGAAYAALELYAPRRARLPPRL